MTKLAPEWVRTSDPARYRWNRAPACSCKENALCWHTLWKECDSPTSGVLFDLRRKTRYTYHRVLRTVKRNSDNISAVKLADGLSGNDNSFLDREEDQPRWLSGLRRSRVHSLMIARRSLCPDKLGSNPGQGSKGINLSGWHGLDMSITVTKRR